MRKINSSSTEINGTSTTIPMPTVSNNNIAKVPEVAEDAQGKPPSYKGTAYTTKKGKSSMKKSRGKGGVKRGN